MLIDELIEHLQKLRAKFGDSPVHMLIETRDGSQFESRIGEVFHVESSQGESWNHYMMLSKGFK